LLDKKPEDSDTGDKIFVERFYDQPLFIDICLCSLFGYLFIIKESTARKLYLYKKRCSAK